jgi:hypothetical protein
VGGVLCARRTQADSEALPPGALIDILFFFSRSSSHPVPKKPAAWYLAQVEKYLLRLNPETLGFVRRLRNGNDWRHPRIGVHIRRSDKLEAEAKYHATTRYYNVRARWKQRAMPRDSR